MSISLEDFSNACLTLESSVQSLKVSTNWEDAKVLESYGTYYLRILRRITLITHGVREHQASGSRENKEFVEDDDEALSSSGNSVGSPAVLYDVIHSPSYQVPVLYITFKDFAAGGTAVKDLPSVDEAYELLVPDAYRSQIEAVGVLGALSMTDHPISGTPAYFVHPCRTAEGMDAVVGGRKTKPEEYLLMWLGMIGASVGIDVPVELAEAMSRPVQQ
ncbi:hypothetical protein LTR37_009010 [Vermiconidia calcicola]|uniref:Uncharacterized protein n=1 Tax=Vermiconidia calcicola TaxID=1690605 RepID=A0ACC3N966_9PEZI|nr:hypothetical protein LTR37_009010 [Vermiconidia calcicola]